MKDLFKDIEEVMIKELTIGLFNKTEEEISELQRYFDIFEQEEEWYRSMVEYEIQGEDNTELEEFFPHEIYEMNIGWIEKCDSDAKSLSLYQIISELRNLDYYHSNVYYRQSLWSELEHRCRFLTLKKIKTKLDENKLPQNQMETGETIGEILSHRFLTGKL